MCAFDRDIRLRDSTRSKGIRRSKILGVESIRKKAGWEYEKKMESNTEGAHVCLFNVGVGSR